ncbi:MAG: PDC sensor domain-containing protein [Spirochaetaceae bacterium]|jgi:methyl-accepting chemotaxis protein|nr:PDC sensor domain-containing protein [Spirochaetaceae bacterium]
MKLKMKLTGLMVVLMIFIAAIISMVLLSWAARVQTMNARENMKNMAGLYAKDLKNYYENTLDIARILSQIMGGYKNIEGEDRRPRFNEAMFKILEANPQVEELYTVWRPGLIDGRDGELARTPGTDASGGYISWYTRESGTIELRPYPDYRFFQTHMPDRETVSDPISRIVNGRPVFFVSFYSPIIPDKDDKAAGMVGITINLSYSLEVINKLRPFGDGSAGLYAYNGLIVAHNLPGRIGHDFRELGQQNFGVRGITLIEDSLSSGSPVSFEYQGRLVQSYPFTIGKVTTPWTLLTTVPLATILSEIRIMRLFVIALAASTISLSALIIFIIAAGITKPITGWSESPRLPAVNPGPSGGVRGGVPAS